MSGLGLGVLRSPMMRLGTILVLLPLPGALGASEAAPASQGWPLWDGHESVADMPGAHLPTSKLLDVGRGVKLEVVLIRVGSSSWGCRRLCRWMWTASANFSAVVSVLKLQRN